MAYHKGGAELGYRIKEYTVTFTENTQLFPVSTSNPALTQNNTRSSHGSDEEYKWSGRFGLIEGLDIFYKNDGDGVLGAKYQFLGKSRYDATRGDFSAALAAEYGYFREEDDYDEYTVKSDSWDVSLLAGYRLSDKTLVYTSLFTSRYDYSINIDPFAVNQNQQNFSGDIEVNGVTLGFNIDITNNFYLTVEALNSELVAGESEIDETFFGLNVGARY